MCYLRSILGLRAAWRRRRGPSPSKAIQPATEAEFQRSRELFDKKVISVQEYENKQAAEPSERGKGQEPWRPRWKRLSLTWVSRRSLRRSTVSPEFLRPRSEIWLVPAGSTSTLTNESKVDPIRLYFPISEREYREHSDLLRAAMNKPDSERQAVIEMLFADGTVYPQKGKFSFINRQVDPTTGTILVAANFPNSERTLRPGQFAVARAAIENIPGA